MLKQLRIQNFAIIDNVEIAFTDGLNIISGETGAGKSIIMDALLLILGGRASTDLIRKGSNEAIVEALFEIDNDKQMLEKLHSLGIDAADGDLIVRRLIQTNGKNRISVNGALVNTGTLASITSHLVDLCSQHDQQLLSRPEEQLAWLDRYANLENDCETIENLYKTCLEKFNRLESLNSNETARAQRLDFLKFQLTELTEAELYSSTEDSEIENELKVLNHSEALFNFSSEAEATILGSELSGNKSMLSSAGILLNKANTLIHTDPKLAALAENLSNLKVILEDSAHFLRSYSQSVTRDETRLEQLNARGAQLNKLKRKYGPTLSEVLENFQKFQEEFSLLENHDSSIAEAQSAYAAAKLALLREAQKLSAARVKAAEKFSTAVEKELKELHMERARFTVELTKLTEPNSTGIDSIRLMIAANPGEAPGALNKIASGGELSRIMLAIHNVVSSRMGVGVFLFDEIDAGIGGKTALTVGAKLQKVALNNQVICITHLPQVASFAKQQFRVEKEIIKKSGEERTVTSVVALSPQERVFEIARMLGGSEKDKTAIAAAKTMMENAILGQKKKSKNIRPAVQV